MAGDGGTHLCRRRQARPRSHRSATFARRPEGMSLSANKDRSRFTLLCMDVIRRCRNGCSAAFDVRTAEGPHLNRACQVESSDLMGAMNDHA